MVICLERRADLHMAQLMSLPLTVYCFSKIQIGFTFLVPAHLGSPGQRAVKRLSVDTKLETFFPCSLYLGVWCGNEETIPNTDYIFKPPRSKHATGINKKQGSIYSQSLMSTELPAYLFEKKRAVEV